MAINISNSTGSSINPKNKKFVLRSKAISDRTRNKGISDLDVIRYINVLGEEIVDGIEYEAREASRLYDAVPREEAFFKSFYYEVGNGDIIIYSKWEWITKYLRDRDPEKMDWLTKQGNSTLSVIPLKDSKGQMIFRSVPLMKTDAWVHPAIKKWTWIQKGVARGTNIAINKIIRLILTEEKIP
ncbi:hypothetical protein EB001_09840 [bacterium]|nr:hypothetical protein [bacterium]